MSLGQWAKTLRTIQILLTLRTVDQACPQHQLKDLKILTHLLTKISRMLILWQSRKVLRNNKTQRNNM